MEKMNNESWNHNCSYSQPEIMNNSSLNDESFSLVPFDTAVGLILAFASCFFIGISIIYKKLALRDIQARGGTRAVDGGYGYLLIPKWWLGIILMGLGELTNFVAYIFAPAILVTPLGVFSVVFTAMLSPYFLKEKLGLVGKLGCVLVLVGCVIVTLCGPKDKEISSMTELQEQLLYPVFLVYCATVVCVSVVLMALVPRFGHKYVLFYLTICSSFGSLSVMFCKGVGLALKETIGGVNEFTNWATWVCIVSLVVSLLIETIYLQKALDLFSSSLFMSVNYVMFTTMVIIASSILYTELRELGWKNIVLTFLGFIVNIVALYLLHISKDENGNVVKSHSRNIGSEFSQQSSLKSRSSNVRILKTNDLSRSSPLSNLALNPSLFYQTNCSSSNFMKVNDASPNMEQGGRRNELKLYPGKNFQNENEDAVENIRNVSDDVLPCNNAMSGPTTESETICEHSLLKKLLPQYSPSSLTDSRSPKSQFRQTDLLLKKNAATMVCHKYEADENDKFM